MVFKLFSLWFLIGQGIFLVLSYGVRERKSKDLGGAVNSDFVGQWIIDLFWDGDFGVRSKF